MSSEDITGLEAIIPNLVYLDRERARQATAQPLHARGKVLQLGPLSLVQVPSGQGRVYCLVCGDVIPAHLISPEKASGMPMICPRHMIDVRRFNAFRCQGCGVVFDCLKHASLVQLCRSDDTIVQELARVREARLKQGLEGGVLLLPRRCALAKCKAEPPPDIQTQVLEFEE